MKVDKVFDRKRSAWRLTILSSARLSMCRRGFAGKSIRTYGQGSRSQSYLLPPAVNF